MDNIDYFELNANEKQLLVELKNAYDNNNLPEFKNHFSQHVLPLQEQYNYLTNTAFNLVNNPQHQDHLLALMMDIYHARHTDNTEDLADDYQAAKSISEKHFSLMADSLDSLNSLMVKFSQTEKIINDIDQYISQDNQAKSPSFLKYLNEVSEPVLLNTTFISHHIEQLEEASTLEAGVNQEVSVNQAQWLKKHKM